MARGDLLLNLVKAGVNGDTGTFRRTVDAIVADERGKQHNVLADQTDASPEPRMEMGFLLFPSPLRRADIGRETSFPKSPRAESWKSLSCRRQRGLRPNN